MSFVGLVIAILAGISASCLPPIARRWYWETQSFTPPLPKPDDPRPNGPLPDPWVLVGGLLAGAGGALAWIALGDSFAGEGRLLPPVVLGFLGGIAAVWLVDSVRNLSRPRARP